jgi:hypothetical protein
VLGNVVCPRWLRPLHADEARSAKAVLVRESGTVVIEVPYRI